jgi:hypothetical protein
MRELAGRPSAGARNQYPLFGIPKSLKLKRKLDFSCIMVNRIKPPQLLGYAYEGDAHRADNNNK